MRRRRRGIVRTVAGRGIVEGTGGRRKQPLERAQIAALYWVLYGERVEPDSAPVTEAWALFEGLHAMGRDDVRAWALTLTTLFQDIRVAYY